MSSNERRLLSWQALAVLVSVSALSSCSSKTPHPPTQTIPDGGQTVAPEALAFVSVNTRFVTMDHMMASLEMQLSGEPLAEAMGRDLTGYSRDFVPPNVYFDPSPTATGPWTDLPGFSTAVESYEYSKQPMNNLNLESGAGVSLAFGPVINPTGATGADALNLLKTAVQHFASESGVTTLASWNGTLPNEAPNVLGWPGLWPVVQPYDSFDPTIQPSSDIAWLCSIASDDDPGAMGGVLNEDYECDYTSLHLPNRAQQVDFVITPGASGWTGWKSGLWTVNYLQIMHDAAGTPVASVNASDLATVGTSGNMIVGQPSQSGTMTVPGTYLGSSNIEGFQAAMMIEEIDNAAQQWLSSLTTTDGTTLSGFGSIQQALQYDFTSPLRWIPAQIAVQETPDASTFPRPSGFTIKSADSNLLGLLGLLGAYSEFYALTDLSNANIGGTQTVEAYFDGDPFTQDDQKPDGEATLHDRALAMMRFIVVDLDRIQRDPASGILADDVQMSNGTPVRGSTIDAAAAAYTLVALRNVRRSLNSQLSLYSNTTPDIAVESTPLDQVPFNGAPGGATFTQRLTSLIDTHAELFYNHLSTADGHAFTGWNFATGTPTSMDDTLDAHTAAIRGLLQAYLSTGNTKYRDRAVAVFKRMDRVFYDPVARLFNTAPGPVTQVSYTPRRFGLLEGALRDMYELWGNQPGHEELGAHLEQLIARHIKLILNGWDDINGDGKVQWPDECLHVENGLPRGGLQMAERALSGELGSVSDKLSDAATRVRTTDRDQDCVPDIAAAGLPSALASEIVLKVKQP